MSMRLLLFNLATDVDDPVLGFTTSWITALAKRTEHIYVITMRAGRIKVPDNVTVFSVGKEKGYSKPHRVIQFYKVLAHVIRNHDIQVCFSHMIPLFTVMAGPVLKARGIPIVTWFAHPRLTLALRCAHYLSDRMVSSLPSAYPYKRNKLVTVGQGIDCHHFRPDPLMPVNETTIILCVGRLSPVKGLLTLIEAAALLRSRVNRQFLVKLLGSPLSRRDEHYVDCLRQRIAELALENSVELQPAIPMDFLPAHYRQATVHINLTPTGSGDKVVLEAMSCGCPTLVANAGFEETLGDYAKALLFNHGDAEQLASRLEWIVSLADTTRREMGLYLRDRVLKMHMVEGLADRLVDIFGCVISKRPVQILD